MAESEVPREYQTAAPTGDASSLTESRCLGIALRALRMTSFALSFICLPIASHSSIGSLALVPAATAAEIAGQALYRDCPPTDARGRPKIDFVFAGFDSKKHAEQATFDYLKCFAGIEAIKEWLAEQGFKALYVYEKPDREVFRTARTTLSATRSMEEHGPFWGEMVSRRWQRTIAYGVSVGVDFYENDKVSRIKFSLLIL